MGGDLAPNLGDQKIFSRPNFRKNFHFQGKISDDLFLVIDLVLQIFPFFSHIFRMFTMSNVVYDTIFHSVHAFTHIRQHYFSKYWGGDQCMGGPPHLKFWGGPSPQSPLGLRPCLRLALVPDVVVPEADSGAQGAENLIQISALAVV